MNNTELVTQAKQIRCVICDIDGVMTDGRLYLDNNGNELKAFHVQDGLGLKLLMAAGIQVAVITTSISEIIENRMRQLGIINYFKGQVNKEAAFLELQSRLNLDFNAFAYIGDDLPDIPLMQQSGLGIAVANAVEEVKKIADWQTKNRGGAGAIREAADFILKAQGQFDAALRLYLKT